MEDSLMSTINDQEVEKFSRIAEEWWDENGKFKPLHKFNPIRISFINRQISNHFFAGKTPEKGEIGKIKILDVGCGGGLIAEPFARFGFDVTAIDASAKNIAIAEIHAEKSGLKIDYQNKAIEDMPDNGAKFDVILALEIIEHVADTELFIKNCARILKPGGILFVATLNRTLKSLALGKFAVEYVLRWLPAGTHDWKKFLKPSEINLLTEQNSLQLKKIQGFSYNIFCDEWKEADDLDINYAMVFEKVS
jgi:2-polyprenyl-6-hydroxyphenyl methylase/3-demethylubiquinone-9 3-methyltransferase